LSFQGKIKKPLREGLFNLVSFNALLLGFFVLLCFYFDALGHFAWVSGAAELHVPIDTASNETISSWARN